MPLTIRTLKDGYWDLTTLVRATDGMLRVRKESRETANPGPWAHEALRNEISYLQNLPDPAKPYFPPLLDCWDDRTIGYEIPFYSDRPDLARLVLEKGWIPRPSRRSRTNWPSQSSPDCTPPVSVMAMTSASI